MPIKRLTTLQTKPHKKVYGLVLLNASSKVTPNFFDFKQLKGLPILDVYTLQAHDPQVRSAALLRKAKSRQAGNSNYQQGFFLSEEYNFSKTQNMLANRIYSWLNNNIKSITLEEGKVKAPGKKK
ncbi:DUF3530 family protein [Piscirickettsia litoralis]|uniref:DUF3530 family protein n=1 Tax=Piscirickettsia litoralis TaxID=1891921 RepID=UPI001F348CD1|nr:DUF3530 family protein [Piscirickettsia litoralis]